MRERCDLQGLTFDLRRPANIIPAALFVLRSSFSFELYIMRCEGLIYDLPRGETFVVCGTVWFDVLGFFFFFIGGGQRVMVILVEIRNKPQPDMNVNDFREMFPCLFLQSEINVQKKKCFNTVCDVCVGFRLELQRSLGLPSSSLTKERREDFYYVELKKNA